jgi:hypothetical protein
MTRCLVVALAPLVILNGLEMGAILPPATGAKEEVIIKKVPV